MPNNVQMQMHNNFKTQNQKLQYTVLSHFNKCPPVSVMYKNINALYCYLHDTDHIPLHISVANSKNTF